MNLREELKAQGSSEEEAEQLGRIASVISERFGDRIDELTAIALLGILSGRTIRLADGTCWNDAMDPCTEIWSSDAAAIVAVLCREPRDTYSGWRRRYLCREKNNAEYRSARNRAVERLRSSPLVLSVED